ncbi:MAG: hypothetical protein JWR19_40 [Pedosphaera sp.]|nr:hypothetical protein [Pedosphaera sp.]
MTKTRIIIIALFLFFIAYLCFIECQQESPVKIVGNMLPKDIAEIKLVVDRERRREVFLDWSWKSIKRLPANLKFYSQNKVRLIEYQEEGITFVLIAKSANTYRYGGLHYLVCKGTNGWYVGASGGESPNLDGGLRQ